MLQVGFWDDFVAVIAGSIHCVPSPGVAANWTGVVEAGEALEVESAVTFHFYADTYYTYRTGFSIDVFLGCELGEMQCSVRT